MCAGGRRKRSAAPRQRRQAAVQGADDYEDVEAEFNPENPYHVSHTNKLSRSCLFTSGCSFGSCLFRSEGAEEVGGRGVHLRRVSHSCRSGSRCWGHGATAQIVTAHLREWIFCSGLSKAFLSGMSLYE